MIPIIEEAAAIRYAAKTIEGSKKLKIGIQGEETRVISFSIYSDKKLLLLKFKKEISLNGLHEFELSLGEFDDGDYFLIIDSQKKLTNIPFRLS